MSGGINSIAGQAAAYEFLCLKHQKIQKVQQNGAVELSQHLNTNRALHMSFRYKGHIITVFVRYTVGHV